MLNMTNEDIARIRQKVLAKKADLAEAFKPALYGGAVGAGVGGLYSLLSRDKKKSTLPQLLHGALLGGGIGASAGGVYSLANQLISGDEKPRPPGATDLRGAEQNIMQQNMGPAERAWHLFKARFMSPGQHITNMLQDIDVANDSTAAAQRQAARMGVSGPNSTIGGEIAGGLERWLRPDWVRRLRNQHIVRRNVARVAAGEIPLPTSGSASEVMLNPTFPNQQGAPGDWLRHMQEQGRLLQGGR